MKFLQLTALFAATCFTSLAFADAPTAAQTAASQTPNSYTSQSVDPAKKAEILKVLKLTDSERTAKQMVSQTFAILQKDQPKDSQEIFHELSKKMQVEIPSFTSELVSIYDRYYTMDDLKAMDAFYSSPEGQKILSVQPKIMQEVMMSANSWAQQFAAEMRKRDTEALKKEKQQADDIKADLKKITEEEKATEQSAVPATK